MEWWVIVLAVVVCWVLLPIASIFLEVVSKLLWAVWMGTIEGAVSVWEHFVYS